MAKAPHLAGLLLLKERLLSVSLISKGVFPLRRFIPLTLEAARLLAALIRPNHLVRLSSWGLNHLPPPCNSNDFG